MFVVPDEVPGTEEEGPVLSGKADLMALKPMNCPAHIQIFNQGIKSYRDLPLRMAEFGCCHRNEAHGALHGLMRVRQMTQDDAHIFCREDQIQTETERFVDLLYSVYERHGLRPTSSSSSRPGRRSSAAPTSAGTRPRRRWAMRCRATGLRLRHRRGRGRLLRAQARVPPDGRHRPHLAGAARSSSTTCCPSGSTPTYVGEDGARKYAGHAAPRDPRLARALHRHADRELCRPACRCGWRRCRWWSRPSSRTPTPMREKLVGAARRRRASGPSSTCATRRSTTRCASTPRQGAADPRRRQARGRGGHRVAPPPRREGQKVMPARRGRRRAGRRGDAARPALTCGCAPALAGALISAHARRYRSGLN